MSERKGGWNENKGGKGEKGAEGGNVAEWTNAVVCKTISVCYPRFESWHYQGERGGLEAQKPK